MAPARVGAGCLVPGAQCELISGWPAFGQSDGWRQVTLVVAANCANGRGRGITRAPPKTVDRSELMEVESNL
jgi:hypothetical protein